jgi:hypothetical protein
MEHWDRVRLRSSPIHDLEVTLWNYITAKLSSCRLALYSKGACQG